MIYVCDAIMGTGKTSAAINFMNTHRDRKFLYVTPNLTETERITKGCPKLQFIQPRQVYEHGFEKRKHLKSILEYGENAAITHVLFSMFDEEMIAIAKGQGYTVILDETIDALEKSDIKRSDVEAALDSRFLRVVDVAGSDAKVIEVTDVPYNGDWMKNMRRLASSRRLVSLFDPKGNEQVYCWSINRDLLEMGVDTYVLTYLFNASSLAYLCQIENIEYQSIGIMRGPDGRHWFADRNLWIPDSTKQLHRLIEVVQNQKMNAIGDKVHKGQPLSASWQQAAAYNKSNGRADELRKNLHNYFRNIHHDAKGNEKLWTTGKLLKNYIKGPGYAKNFIPFNVRATNDYKDATCLAYVMNVFLPVAEKIYYQNKGANVNDDAYALSVMVQWIWRSAIRDGKKVNLYLPSERMRSLLAQWIEQVESGLVGGDITVQA